MSVLFKNARVLTQDDDRNEHAEIDVLVEGGIITAIAPGLTPPDPDTRIVEARGHVLMPGLVNGHLHSPGNFMKGANEDCPLELFMLYEVPPFMTAPESARLHYLRSLLGAVEMLKVGVTSVHDDAFFVPFPTTDTVAAVMRAYRDAGMRCAVTLDQPNVVEYEKYPFLEEILPPAIREEMRLAAVLTKDELLAAYRDYIATWDGAENGRLRCAVSCSAPQRVTPDYLAALTELSKEHDLPFDIHILETRVQRVTGQVKHGKSLIRYVDDLGLLDERKMVIHAIWIDPADIEVMARSGCSIAHNPISNLRIGSGVMPFRQIVDAGIPVCIGSDEAPVDDTANVWIVGKVAGMIHKISDPDYRRWPKAQEILDCMTRGGARAMRNARKVGQVRVGFEADLILIDLDTIAYTPLNDLKRQLVFCENGNSVVLTMVQGKIVAEEGRVLGIDEKQLRAEVREIMAEYRPIMEATRANAARLWPYYQAMYERTLEVPVPMQRWVPTFDA